MHAGIANWWFPLKLVAGKRSRHSRRMRIPKFYVSSKRPMVGACYRNGCQEWGIKRPSSGKIPVIWIYVVRTDNLTAGEKSPSESGKNINSLVPEKCGSNFARLFFEVILWIDILITSCKTGLMWVLLNTLYGKSSLGLVMAWCRQTTSHYLGQKFVAIWCQ